MVKRASHAIGGRSEDFKESARGAEEPVSTKATLGIGSCLSAASFWQPEYKPDSAWREHAPFAFWLVDALRPRTVVELGTHNGFSYFCFCQAVKTLNLNATCHAIDTWQGDEHAGYYGEEVFNNVSAHNQENYSSFSRLMRTTFDEALPQFVKNSIDLLHIDGRHFYDDVKHDFESWRPKLSKRSVVLFHDTTVRDRDFGVERLWSEISADQPHFEFHHCHGLGVLATGPDVPAAVRLFLEAVENPDTALDVREAYTRLGRSIAVGATDAGADLADARRENARLQAELEGSVCQLEDKLRLQEAATEQAYGRIGTLQERIEAIHASRSWRVTAPLRAVSRMALRREDGEDSTFDKAPSRDLSPPIHPIAPTPGLSSDYKPRTQDKMTSKTHTKETLPSDFDPATYLALNKDVAKAGADPVKHYLTHGMKEGRRYLPTDPPRIRDDLLERLANFQSILELGPFDNPVAPKYSKDATIEYVDWLSQEALIARAAALSDRNPQGVPYIDYVISDGHYVDNISKKFDCVVSCHMIEHTPDLIFHLQQVRAILNENGSYIVILPDKSRCFDHYLPESSLPEVLTAHLERRTKPTLRSVIEHRAFTSSDFPIAANPLIQPTPYIRYLAEKAELEYVENAYVDVHCWQFTAASLQTIINSIVLLGLIDRPSTFDIFQMGTELGMQLSW